MSVPVKDSEERITGFACLGPKPSVSNLIFISGHRGRYIPPRIG